MPSFRGGKDDQFYTDTPKAEGVLVFFHALIFTRVSAILIGNLSKLQ